jgi:hypothetical protein
VEKKRYWGKAIVSGLEGLVRFKAYMHNRTAIKSRKGIAAIEQRENLTYPSQERGPIVRKRVSLSIPLYDKEKPR